jgi:molybdopterin-guanine dinucleotide biosynthesis protein A
VSEPASYAVVVLSGGSSRRLGGGDKTALDLGAGRSVLDHLVSGLDTSVPVVVVGPGRPLERSVQWARERPPGGGPVAGLAAGLEVARRGLPDLAWVVVLAGAQPFAAAGLPVLLAARVAGADAVVGLDLDGRDQPLLAAYRAPRLAAQLDGDLAGRSMRSVLAGLVVVRVALPARSCLDIDDEESLNRARAEFGNETGAR